MDEIVFSVAAISLIFSLAEFVNLKCEFSKPTPLS